MKKKIVTMVMALTMAAGALTGCADSAGNTETTKPAESTASGSSAAESTAGAVTEAAEEEPVEINWLGYYTSNLNVAENSWAEQLLEENFNVKINAVTGVTKESIEVFVNSGDILDVTCYLTHLYTDVSYMYEQDLIREIPEEWLYEYYPTGMQLFAGFVGEEFFTETKGHLEDGKCLYIPHNNNLQTDKRCIVYRKDWLENLGMKEPATLEEFHDMLYAFTYNDPDGNGVDDTYGIAFERSHVSFWPILGAFGIAESTYTLQEDGSVTYSMAQEEYREALSILKQWYDEGIIEPNMITDDRAALRTKWSNGTIGAICDTQTWFYSNRGSSSIIGMVESLHGEGIVEVMGPLTTTYGDGTVYAPKSYPSVKGNRALVFTAEATDEQVIAVLKMLEGLATNDELAIKILYGEEGVDYTMTDGSLQVSPDINVEYQASKGIGDTFYGVFAKNPRIVNLTFSERDLANLEKADAWETMYYGQNFVAVTNEASDQYLSEVKKVVSEFYTNVLLGEADVEKDWDQYIADLNQAGLDKILAEYEEKLK